MTTRAPATLSFVLSTRGRTVLGLGAALSTIIIVRAIAATLDLPRPGQIAVVASAMLVAWMLARHRVPWPAVGIVRPTHWVRTLLAGAGLYLAATAAIVAVVYPLGRALGLPPMQLDAFAGLRGNLPMLLAVLAMVWTTVAFGEEFVFRGFVQRAIAGALGEALPRSLVAALAVLLQALAFGGLHAYLGPSGVLNATIVALVFGAALHLTRGNLWPLVIAHGLTDTVAMVAIYSGLVPA